MRLSWSERVLVGAVLAVAVAGQYQVEMSEVAEAAATGGHDHAESTGMDHGDGGMMMMHHMMQMTFENSTEVTLFFSSWKTKNPTAYAFSLIALVLSGVLSMFLKYCRATRSIKHRRGHHADDEATAGTYELVDFGLALLFYFIDYLLMLTAMTFNVGVFLAVIAGLATGAAAFNPKRILDYQHAHPSRNSTSAGPGAIVKANTSDAIDYGSCCG